jgi:hypothetical protein
MLPLRVDRIEITADRVTTIADEMNMRSDRNQLARTRLTSIASTLTGTEDIPQSRSAFDPTPPPSSRPPHPVVPGALPAFQKENTQ